MERQELEAELEELEYRLERLRSLYEQYFLGIEKIEPSVARKDVDRRFWMLRRIQIRNTARRFKLQTLVQRYNTFQQYWQRTCREIENGTYTRQLLRAKRRMGETEALTWAAKRRLGLYRRQPAGDGEEQDRAAEAREQAESDMAELMQSGVDAATEAERAVTAALAAVESVRAPTPHVPSREVNPLSLKLDLEGDLDQDRKTPTASRPPPPSHPPPPPVGGRVPPPTLPKTAAVDERRSPPLPHQARPAAGPAPAGARPDGVGSRTAAAAPRREPGSASPGARPTATAGSPARPAVNRTDGATNAWALLDRQKPAWTSAQSAPKHAPERRSDLSQDRVQELHAQLVAAKRKLNQRTPVSVDGLAKTLRATHDKLRTKHNGREVDFRVVIRDGQAVVKPIFRK